MFKSQERNGLKVFFGGVISLHWEDFYPQWNCNKLQTCQALEKSFATALFKFKLLGGSQFEEKVLYIGKPDSS